MERKNPSVTVIGLGGVGGYVGALLADHYDHVTFVIRGDRAERVSKQGLCLHSDHRGERITRPERVVLSAEELEPQDYVFVCVKNYSLEDVCRTLGHAVDDHTVVIPVMNGVDPGRRLEEYLNTYTGCSPVVLDSLIYIVSFLDEEGAIRQQGDFATIYLGSARQETRYQQEAKRAVELLQGAELDCHFAEDILAEIWKKYMLNCAYNVATAAYDCPIGPLRADAERSAQYETLVWEAFAVAKAQGVHVKREDAEHIIWRFYHDHAEDASSSLQRDVMACRPNELETFSGYLVREAKRLGVDAPVSEMMYRKLKVVTRIRESLMKLQDEKYQKFHARLIPNISPQSVIGVRVPVLRQFAKEVRDWEDVSVFLDSVPHLYYDENLLHVLLICGIKDYDECMGRLCAFLPYMDNWALTDAVRPACFKKNLPALEKKCLEWIRSDREYTIRQGVVLLMTYFLDDAFRPEQMEQVAQIRSEDYYARMAVAWYFATALARQRETALPYMEQRRLDEWTHRKTIQKARESFRVDESLKEHLRMLR